MDEPMYRQIAKDLRDQIKTGRIAPGSQLPTELELRDHYNASRNTVRDAIKWLVANGVVAAKTGQGIFAVQGATPFAVTLSVSAQMGLSDVEGAAEVAEIERRGRRPWASVPRVEVRSASPDMATQLRIPEESAVVTRRQERRIDRMPWSIQATAYPMELVKRGASGLLVAQDIDGGAVAYLERALGVRQIGCRDTIDVRPPSEEEDRFFRFPDDAAVSAVTVVTRTGYRASEAGPAPFRVTSTMFPADRVRIVINAGGVPRDGTPLADNEHPQAADGERRADPADQALRHSHTAQARQVPHTLAHSARRLPGHRSAPVFLADSSADGEEGAEQNAEGDGSDERKHDKSGDEASHDGLQLSVPRPIRGSPMSRRGDLTH